MTLHDLALYAIALAVGVTAAIRGTRLRARARALIRERNIALAAGIAKKPSQRIIDRTLFLADALVAGGTINATAAVMLLVFRIGWEYLP